MTKLGAGSFSVEKQVQEAYRKRYGKKSGAILERFMLDAIKGNPEAVGVVVSMYDSEIRRLELERDEFVQSASAIHESKANEAGERARMILSERMAPWFKDNENHVPDDLTKTCRYVSDKAGVKMDSVKELVRAMASEMCDDAETLAYVDDRLMGVE